MLRACLISISMIVLAQMGAGATELKQSFFERIQMRLPPGSYQYTCDSCRFDGRLLNCRCRTSGGDWLRSSIDWGGNCGGDVSNHEGRLVCASR
jgi:hypothetical protein